MPREKLSFGHTISWFMNVKLCHKKYCRRQCLFVFGDSTYLCINIYKENIWRDFSILAQINQGNIKIWNGFIL